MFPERVRHFLRQPKDSVHPTFMTPFEFCLGIILDSRNIQNAPVDDLGGCLAIVIYSHVGPFVARNNDQTFYLPGQPGHFMVHQQPRIQTGFGYTVVFHTNR